MACARETHTLPSTHAAVLRCSFVALAESALAKRSAVAVAYAFKLGEDRGRHTPVAKLHLRGRAHGAWLH
jgi:hypothetical protein